jgi:hypothetical protein
LTIEQTNRSSFPACWQLIRLPQQDGFLTKRAQIIVQAVETFVRDAVERLQPEVQVLEGFRPQLVDPAIGHGMHLHETCLTEYAKMFRNLRLLESEPVGDIPDGQGTVAQNLDNVQTIWLG